MSIKIETYHEIHRGVRTGYRAFKVSEEGQQVLLHDSGAIFNDEVHAKVAASKRGFTDKVLRGPNVNPKADGTYSGRAKRLLPKEEEKPARNDNKKPAKRAA